MEVFDRCPFHQPSSNVSSIIASYLVVKFVTRHWADYMYINLFCCLFVCLFVGFIKSRSCSNNGNQPSSSNNIRGETYSTGSRCFEHGRGWNRIDSNGQRMSVDRGVGCYQVNPLKNNSSTRSE